MSSPLSIIIKTFERPLSLKNLLFSIRRRKLTYPLLIADDSRQSSKEEILAQFPDLKITYLDLPFDTGLSEGRNVLVNHVGTPWFVLCDDDYVFDDRADFEKAYQCAVQNNLDIVGGDYYNYVNIPSLKVFMRQLTHPFRLKRFFMGQFQTSSYTGIFHINGESCELIINRHPQGNGLYRCDLVNNFFVARTASVLSMGGWDKSLKMGEHEDFFLRAKQHDLKVAYLSGFGTGHYPAIPIKGSAYNQYRVRAAHYKSLFVKKHGFKHYVEIEKETNKLLFKAG